MAGPWVCRRLILTLAVTLGVLGPAALSHAGLLTNHLTDHSTGSSVEGLSPGLPAANRTTGPVLIYSPSCAPLPRGAVALLGLDGDQVRLLQVFQSTMIWNLLDFEDTGSPPPPPSSTSTSPQPPPHVGPPAGPPGPPLHAPEPGTLVLGLLGTTLAGLVGWRRRIAQPAARRG